MFTTVDGAPLRPDYLTGRFRRLVAASGQPPIRLHDLRHGAATLALAAHTDLKVVQAMLGHASIVLTADTYVSVLPEVAHHAARETAPAGAESRVRAGAATRRLTQLRLTSAPGRAGARTQLRFPLVKSAPCRIRTCDRRIRSKIL
ncbi:tyrosine-type recombinase/integrase [Nonomuraea sp. NPDC049504]|uniref:tyrosine-type recombinase/integrase n=1 Tax=Nonomuraea sp. NPDC049504 TaxID=3154729 RepID=UPI003432AAD3